MKELAWTLSWPARVFRAQFSHRAFLLKLLPQQSVGAEIGVFEGKFTDQILRMVKPRELHLVDPWKHESEEVYKTAWFGGAAGGQAGMDARLARVQARFARGIAAGRLKIQRGYSDAVIGGFPDAYFDWIYIDGNHLYEFVQKDLELAWRKVRPGGVICGDDYGEGGWWEGGVKRAVDEFITAKNATVLGLKNGQFALRR